MEDLDEATDRVIEGTYKYATSNVSPTKMNTGRKKSREQSLSPESSVLSDSDSAPPSLPPTPRREESKKMKSIGKGKKIVVTKGQSSQRPTMTRGHKTTSSIPSRLPTYDETSYYGIPQETIPASSGRPRANTRPQSYYGQSTRPPLSHSAYSHMPPQGGPPPHPFQPPGSFPPPLWAGPPPPGQMVHQPMVMSPPPYLGGRPEDHLAARFHRQDRPQSAMGFHGHPHPVADYEYDDYESHVPERSLVRRRPSVSRKTKEQEDRLRMPPPPQRPASARPPERLVLRPAPAAHRKSVGFEEAESSDDIDDEPVVYEPSPPRRTSIDYSKGVMNIPRIKGRRRSSMSTEYNDGLYALQPASSNRRVSQRYDIGDKLQEAINSVTQYQNDVSGPPPRLTSEALKKHKQGPATRSTRSSESRDESSYFNKQSAGTGTTRSSSGDDDNITIKVPNGAVVEVGNAKISCGEGGGEISIGRGVGGSQRGSDRGTAYTGDHGTVYNDDRKSRADRPATRHRASSQSQAGSFSRTIAHHPHGYPPPYPPQSYGAAYAPYSGIEYPDPNASYDSHPGFF